VRDYGAVDRLGGTRVVTRFLHVATLPVVPLGCVLVLADALDGCGLWVPTRWDLRSVAVAWVRWWGALASVLLAGWAVSTGSAGAALTALALAGAVVASHLLVGRLSDDEAAQRWVYMDLLGHPADVALVDNPAQRQAWLARVEELAREAGGDGWEAMVQDGTTSSLPLLKTAMTWCRAAWGVEQGPRRAQLAALHDAAWARVKALDPTCMEDARVAR
jgi:hypothetical protein